MATTTLARSTRLLLAGDGFSAFGRWIDYLAILTLAAYQYQVSAPQMALVSAASLLPGVLAAPAVGRWCDHGQPRQLLMASIALRVLATAGLWACDQFAAFMLLVALRSLFATVADPAINVMARRTLGSAGLPRFYSLLNVVNSAAKIAAPALGTVASSLAGEGAALLLSALCSVLALGLLAGVGVPPAVTAADTPAATAPQPLDGQAGARLGMGMAPLLWLGASWAFSVFMVSNLTPLVLQRAGLDKALLGVLVSCSGAGNILTGLWLARRTAHARLTGQLAESIVPALLQAAGFAAIGVLLWLAPRALPVLLPLLFFVIGTCSARFAISLNVHLGTHHGHAIGAASGRLQAWQNSMIFVAPLLGAVILDRWGGPALFWFAAVSAGVSLSLLWATAGRWARRPPVGTAPAGVARVG